MTNAGRLRANGVEIQTNNNSWPYVCDWNEDGRKDLLVGQEGIGAPCNVYVYLNQGTNAEPVFGDSVPVLAGGQPFRNYRCVPLARDLDNDGNKDLILGEWYSSIRFYHNSGTNADPVFEGFVNLVPPDPDSFRNGNPPRIALVDWDGDTDLDMVTCDYYGSVFLRRNVTPVGVDGGAGPLPAVAVLDASPNPVKGRIWFRLQLTRPTRVKLDVLMADGRLLATPYQGQAETGELRCSWDAPESGPGAVQDGVYFVRLSTSTGAASRKLVVAR